MSMTPILMQIASSFNGISFLKIIISAVLLLLGLICFAYFGLKGSAQIQQKKEHAQQQQNSATKQSPED